MKLPDSFSLTLLVQLYLSFSSRSNHLIRLTAFDTRSLYLRIIGFFAFRFFDIVKLEPAKYFDNKDSGWGIMMDDIAAGLYAGIFSAVLTHFAWYQLLRTYLG